MTSRASANRKAAKKLASPKKAAMKKTAKKPAKAVAATKTKKAAPAASKAKKPAKAPAKPAAKAKAPEKKPVVAAKSNDKAKAAPVAAKKAPPPPPAKAVKPVEAKKADAKQPTNAKKEVQDKVVAAKKPEPAADSKSTARPAATATPPKASAKSAATAPAPAPLKVEPKIIETPQIETKKAIVEGDLFTPEELQMFRGLLESERNKILDKAKRAVEEGGIQIERDDLMDEVDQAAAMEAQNLTFRLLDRDRKLLAEIDHAILKLDTGEYGYCEGTGEPIPKRRLELRPWCRHSVKYKEKLERMKKSGRGVVDEDEL